jgi:2'-5' RNA ligase
MSGENAKVERISVSYSIWLMPEYILNDQLQNKIQSLGSVFGGPFFEPHVTLVSGFLGKRKELIEKTETISNKISPFKILFDGIAYLDEFFRPLFLKVKFSPHLRAARNLACAELAWDEIDYLPHMSLIYGDFTPIQKEKMISTLGLFPDSFSVNKIYLIHNDEIQMKWRVIRGFPLTKLL